MFTVLDEDKFVLRNYERVTDVPLRYCVFISVEHYKSLDGKPIIEWCTSKNAADECGMYGYHKDVEIDNETYERYLAIMEY